jgi:hypothetical protein
VFAIGAQQRIENSFRREGAHHCAVPHMKPDKALL